MNKKIKFGVTFLIALVCLIVIGYVNIEVYIASKDKSFGKPQVGYIVRINKDKSNIFVVSDLSKKELQTLKIDWMKSFDTGREMMFYGIEYKDVLEKLKIGQKILIYNNGRIESSNPGSTTATKIIVCSNNLFNF